MRTALLTLLAAWAALLSPGARADVYVVVHAASLVRTLTSKQAVDIYMGRARSFPNGEPALPVDLPRDDAVRTSFYQLLVGMSPAQVNSYWSRLMFTGQTMPPHQVPSEAAVLDLVRRHPNAIGYLGREPAADSGVRVVITLRALP
jgi:ABC-type phosphate transport system substrate-binding protein